MPSSTAYNQGEIVLVPFPFSDLTTAKRRPALVISANWYNRERPDLILLAITSQIPDPPYRDQVEISAADYRMANIQQPCIIRAGKIFTIEKSCIVKTLGRISPGTVEKAIHQLIDVINGK